MIEQYLLNTNESATVSILQKFLEVNKALVICCLVEYTLMQKARTLPKKSSLYIA